MIKDILSEAEQSSILTICALNKIEKKREVNKRIRLGKLNISFSWRSSKNFWGRFGGGWQWALGFEASRHTLNLNCLVFSIMIWIEIRREQ